MPSLRSLLPWLVGLTLGLLPLPLHAFTYYAVPSSGNTSNCVAARNIATPISTAQAGINCLAPGDTLYLRAGTYSENPRILYSMESTAAQPVLVAGYPGDARPLILPPPGTVDSTTYAAIKIMGPGYVLDAYVTFKGIDIDNINASSADNDFGSTCILACMQHVTFDDITCMNSARDGIGGCGLPNNPSSDYLTVRNSRILWSGRHQPTMFPEDTKGIGMYAGAAYALVENNVFDGCRGGGFNVQYNNVHHSVYRNNLIKNVACDSKWGCIPYPGVDTHSHAISVGGTNICPPESCPQQEGAADNQVYNNVVAHGHGSPTLVNDNCLNFWTNSTRTKVWNNTCYDFYNGIMTISAYMVDTYVQNNILANVVVGVNITNEGAVGPGSLVDFNLVNPNTTATFVNAAGDDFRLKAGSPAINAGTNATGVCSIVTTDIAGTTRCIGASIDAGAYEFGSGPPALPAPTNLRIAP